MIREKDIKAALIDWLYNKGQIQDAVIINEMVVANWSRRADIAVANGKLYAYEIKSSADTLKRLPGQVDLFSSHFDKVTVVAAAKFIPKILESYPSHIGVLEVTDEGGAAKIKQIRAGRLNETRNTAILADFLTKTDIHSLLKSEGISVPSTAARSTLVQQISSLPSRSVKKYVLTRLKEKYKDTFEAFSLARSTSNTFDSISLLSKKENAIRATRQRIEGYVESSFSPNPNAKPLSLGGLNLTLEDIAGLPLSVICRKKRA
ncbi:sce7726 family protein [Pseudomonas aeruginosa]|uniref:sce7726 family protein n=1 Tax=Pseudomonas aeruginosa TaxID=287 RepID=UPI0014961760|nr:sce7726 family protein [Pseudomonas aeruginosa]NPT01635.1 sce7726 family protein [Pseudomonas aeruginosa]HBO1307400.1 sce7726 family protein [Pseudomonas aeruginosa]HBO6772673.1 sce7726 family protein [Pseudomonas aeruginosa]HEJ5830810.1 sce7726 family protein [Pseudomonas aeruginosa]HEJ5941242.1 sce7726 family protein [Pseudomonas aeruginosa]